jgi:hypothetical protein
MALAELATTYFEWRWLFEFDRPGGNGALLGAPQACSPIWLSADGRGA